MTADILEFRRERLIPVPIYRAGDALPCDTEFSDFDPSPAPPPRSRPLPIVWLLCLYAAAAMVAGFCAASAAQALWGM